MEAEGYLGRAFGASLLAERRRRGMTQKVFGSEVLGVHRSRVGAVERGANLTLDWVEQFSDRLGIDPVVLLAGPSVDDDAAADDQAEWVRPVLRAAHDGDELEDDLRDRT